MLSKSSQTCKYASVSGWQGQQMLFHLYALLISLQVATELDKTVKDSLADELITASFHIYKTNDGNTVDG
jgi:hypothetical protein